MESKTLNSVLGATEVRRDTVDEMQIGDRKKRTAKSYGSKDVELKEKYDAISKNGDTLELSGKGKRLSEHPDMDNPLIKISKRTGKGSKTLLWIGKKSCNDRWQ